MEHVSNKKYAIKLLFQFRVEKNGISNKKRICEERIIHIMGSDPITVFKKAEKIGYKEQFKYDDRGKTVHFEFIGISEMVDLIKVSDKDEVWSVLTEKLFPMERKKKLIPNMEDLNIFRKRKNKIKI